MRPPPPERACRTSVRRPYLGRRGIGHVTRRGKTQAPPSRAPNLFTNKFLRPFDDNPGEVAPKYTRQGGEGERASCVQHIAAVYGGGVDFYKDLPFRRIWLRNLGRSELRRIPEAFDQDGLHFAIHLHESSENPGYLPHFLERSLQKELSDTAPLEQRVPQRIGAGSSERLRAQGSFGESATPYAVPLVVRGVTQWAGRSAWVTKKARESSANRRARSRSTPTS